MRQRCERPSSAIASDAADAVDVAGDQVPAEARGRQQRALEVDRRAGAQARRAWCSASVSFETSAAKRAGVEGDDGQAHAVHRDALAQLQVGDAAACRWRRAGAGRRRAARARAMRPTACTRPVNIRPPPRVCGRSSRRRSGPTWRESTTLQAEAVGHRVDAAGRRTAAGRASPSSTGATYSSNSSTRPCAQQRAAQRGAGLDLHFVDLALRQLRQQRAQVEALAVARHARTRRVSSLVAGHDVHRVHGERRRRVVEHARAGGEAAAGVEHHAQRRHDVDRLGQAHASAAGRRRARCRCR